MSFGQSARAWAFPRLRVGIAALVERNWVLLVLGLLHTLAYGGFFVVMHLKSLAWAPGQVLEPLPWYWEWFYRSVLSEERVLAARRSDLAALHPFYLLTSLALVSLIYVLLLRWLRSLPVERQPRLQVLLGLVVLASVPLVALPNLLSGDVYSNISFGRVAVVHGGNPFIDPPSRFRSDPLYRWVNWKQVASVYGPGWIYPSILLTIIVNSIKPHVITYLLAYKLLALTLHFVNGWLLWTILTRWRPEQRAWGSALYLLNPLTLIEFVGNAHNDVLMITFILLGVWLHLRGFWYWTIAAFTLAVLTKWIALPLLPLYGLALLWQAPSWRDRARKTMAGAAIVAVLCVGLYRPYWEGKATLKILFDAPPQQRLINSLGEVISNDIQREMWRRNRWPNPALVDAIGLYNTAASRSITSSTLRQPGTNELWSKQRSQFIRDRARIRAEQTLAKVNRDWLNGKIRLAALVLLGAACLVGAAVTRNLRMALLAGAWIFFVYCAIGAVWFWPWYVTWLVALAALLDWRVTGRTAVLFSLLAPLTYVFFPTLPDPVWWQRYRAVMIIVPPLLFAAWHGVRVLRETWQRWRSRKLVSVSA